MADGGKSKVPLIIAALVGLLLVGGVRAFMAGGSDSGSGSGDQPSAVASPGADCTTISVVASSEKAALLKDVAGQYNAAGRQVDGRCAGMVVNSKASGGAADALSRGWNTSTDGPQPDVWSPAASSWAGIVTERLTRADKPDVIPADLPSIAQTPLVIAMPRPMAEALGWPKKAIGWSDLAGLARNPAGWGAFGHPEWGRFKLGKTNPHFSTSGLNATVGSYFAATGVSSDLTEKDVKDPKTTAFVTALERSVVHYGDTTLTFLSNMQRADDAGRGLTYVSAVTVEEKSVWDYNQGNPTGDPTTLGQHAAPRTPLVAVYPKEGTLLSDNPWITLDAPWVDAAKRAVAKDALEFIRGQQVQERFQASAFRTFEGKAGAVLSPEQGLLPDQPASVLSPPSPKVLAAISASWDLLRKPARVLVVLDVSGSMAEPVEGGGSKISLAKDAATKAVEGFAKTDEVGLWAFSTELGPNLEPWVELQPVAKVNVPALQSRIGTLVPDGGTGLYATIRAAEKKMTETLDTGKINAVVVLTDGRNEYPEDNDLESLVADLGGESLDTSVRVFTIGYGKGADQEALKRISGASAAASYDATDPASIEKVLTSVISNF